ncbi:hypothetical protein GXW83_00975 [Streptacidiphilus sp. PB12-B1b]|uniref:hypothetical protein n=1 Tax=Streptacidiphilus sp. PB12-B1b TaxID=2705012 RepID=UPI0015F88F3A|nr:hypothetical protein [Streptacidiphilus sp. PB12-B1b]QMU74568.1 hypothetical protein GXW83_00975 [Streptacidiphilus sp. PB12-B1b]
MTAAVREKELDLGGVPLGKGGQGEVFRVANRRINQQWEVAYKRYKPETRARLNVSVLRKMADLPAELDEADARWLCENTCWPAAVVEDDSGSTCGFLMRLVPRDFFVSAAGVERAAGLEFLLNPDEYLQRAQLPLPSTEQRLRLLAEVAEAMDRLHRLGIVVGDFSPKNVLYRMRPTPGSFFIDCDAMRLAGCDALPQVETPGWSSAAGEPIATQATDAAKFGRLATRLLAKEQDGFHADVLRRLLPELGQLADLSAHADPSRRPGPSAWTGPLREAARAAGTVPPPPPRPAPAPQTGTEQPAPSSAPQGASAPRPSGPNGTRKAGPAQPPAGKKPPPTVPTVRPRTLLRALGALVLLISIWFAATHSGAARTDASGSSAVGTTTQQDQEQGNGTGTGSPSPDGAQQQAAAIDQLLSQNDGTRSQVTDAVNDVDNCTSGGDLSNDVSALQQAAQTRQDLLSQLGALDVSALPGGDQVVSDLKQAWTESIQADQAFASWAQDVQNGSCGSSGADHTSNWDAADDDSRQATADKQAFVTVWTPIAQQYGLTVRTADQL